MKCRHCDQELKKVKNANVKFSDNASYEGVCINDKCEKKGVSVASFDLGPATNSPAAKILWSRVEQSRG